MPKTVTSPRVDSSMVACFFHGVKNIVVFDNMSSPSTFTDINSRQGEKVPLGFIGSVDKLKIYDLPKNGMKLFTEITVVQEVFDITLISAQVKVEDKLIAECRMKIFIKKE